MKTCNICGVEKEKSAFSTKGKDRNGNVRLNGRCKPCHREYMNSYYSDNKEEMLLAMKARRDDPVEGEKIRKSKKAYSKTESAKLLARKRNARYSEKNRDSINKRNRAYHHSNPEKQKKRAAKYRHENREKCNGYVRAKRLKIGKFDYAKWTKRLEYYGGKCVYCGSCESIEIEHRIPVSRGGTNLPANLVPACQKCNRSKGTKTEKEYKALLSE